MKPNDYKEYYSHQFPPPFPIPQDRAQQQFYHPEYLQMPSMMPTMPPQQFQTQREAQMINPPLMQALPEGIGINKGKRRSKNDNEGRVYKCSHCDKTYLSYPALYTHNKTKHPNINQAIVPSRGRGRPRKTMQENQPDPISNLYFSTEDRNGGPTAITYGFKEAFNEIIKDNIPKKYSSYTEHPLYIQLYKLHIENCKTLSYDKEHPSNKEIGDCPAGLPPAILQHNSSTPKINLQMPNPSTTVISTPPQPNLAEPAKPIISEEKKSENEKERLEKKSKKKCDETFAEYLNYVALHTKHDYYALVLKFVLCFRECLNMRGNQLLKNTQTEPEAEEKQENAEFCLTNNAELAPEMCNDFVTIYLEEAKPNLEGLNVIEIIQNMCHWLFMNEYTCSRLNLLRSDR